MAQFDTADLNARLQSLLSQRDAIRAQSAPLRQERDAIEAAARGQVDALNTQILSIESALPPIKEEAATIAKILEARRGAR
jgi:hypothetical protein